jgi:peptide deformylase
MYAEKGIGISAVQIGVLKRVIFIHIPELGFKVELINPTIVSFSKEKMQVNEGCLSFPGVFTNTERYATVSIQFQDTRGEQKYYKAVHPLISQCIQHEMEHLDGILFTDQVCISPGDQKTDDPSEREGY